MCHLYSLQAVHQPRTESISVFRLCNVISFGAVNVVQKQEVKIKHEGQKNTHHVPA
jgi:hypothetical protein